MTVPATPPTADVDDVVDVPALPAGAALPADRNPAAVYLASLSAGAGRRSMRSTLAHVAAMLGYRVDACPWQALRFQHVAALRALFAERYAPATTNKYLSALRQVARQAWLLGGMSGEEYHRIAAVRNVQGSRLPAGRALDGGELRALFRACDDATPAGARDAALLAMLFGCGLRRAEAAAVAVADYDPESGAVRVTGKGDKERLTYAPQGARRAMDDWIAVRGSAPGPLLAPVSKGGTVRSGAGLTPQAIMYRLRRRAAIAAIAAIAACSPHDLRRTFVSCALEAGADLAMVQKLAGHASPTTTERYDRRPEDAKREAASLVHVPYAGAAPMRRRNA